ncbi:MAPEG family protein [Bradyrhizobium sp. BWA-3-5]|uniref:MAPEG family protein n=1 Tax=Bradyrhizobium sp. BWA-3-5 TaxID=3080013 RepID=UPI00293EE491|nr:MAPEG family protein [Bradyrhizobium sp. BWA-3-5]WOH63418.1 MAPEG family protein [Bradyrhizobium sp. BWA-3-5]
MSLQMVLLPVFVQIGLTFFLLLWMVTARTKAIKARETSLRDIAAGQPKYPPQAAQVGNCFSNQFEVPVLFYFLIALELPLRRADLFIVLMSWVFVVTRFAHAGIFVTSNNIQQRSMAWFAGVLVLLAMWLYFALKLLLLI